MEENKKLNIMMFPWLAFGHMIPFLELSKSLASKGHHIFYVSTPRNLKRLEPKIPPNLAPLITLVSIPLPRHESLPPDAEATTDVGFAKGTDILKVVFDGLEEPITEFLESSQDQLDWIIYDFSSHWLPSIADRLGIQKVFFSIYFARTLTIFGPSDDMSNDGAGPWIDWENLTHPIEWIPFPNNTNYFLPHEAKKIFMATKKNSSGISDNVRFKSSVNGCDLIAVRSCVELEDDYIHLSADLHKKVVLPLGLMPASKEPSQEGDDSWQTIGGWLDKHKKGSVIYVALGSEVEPTQEELNELALGLELSELPFFWALRKTLGGLPLELPNGFEERTQDRGLVWTRWVPQVRILAHESVGGFLTHCGWSSIIEALQFGKPLIMLPLAIDQGLYARLMVEKKVGIEIPKNTEDGSFTRRAVSESLTLVVNDDTGKIYHDEAKKLSKIVGDEALQGQYIDKFAKYLQSMT